MTIKAELKFEDITKALDLVRTFITKYKRGYTLEVKGNIVKFSSDFKEEMNSPTEIVDAMKGASEIISLICVDTIEEKEEEKDETSESSETSETSESTESSETPKNKKRKGNDVLPKRKDPIKPSDLTSEIPEIEIIAKKAVDLDGYVQDVLEFFNLKNSKNYDLFKEVFKASLNLDEISWTTIQEKLNREVTASDQVVLGNKFSKKLKELKLNFKPLEVIGIVSSYKQLIGEQKSESESGESDNKSDNESDIPILSKIFEDINSEGKTKEDIVKQILVDMGLEEEDYRAGLRIIAITNAAVLSESDSEKWEEIFDNANIEDMDSLNSRMELSTFINNFAKNNGYDKEITVLDFVKCLRENII